MSLSVLAMELARHVGPAYRAGVPVGERLDRRWVVRSAARRMAPPAPEVHTGRGRAVGQRREQAGDRFEADGPCAWGATSRAFRPC